MDITDIKAENVKQILNHLRFSSGLTKRELAEWTIRMAHSGDMVDLSAIENNTATGIAKDKDIDLSEKIKREPSMADDLDYDPYFQETNSQKVENPDQSESESMSDGADEARGKLKEDEKEESPSPSAPAESDGQAGENNYLYAWTSRPSGRGRGFQGHCGGGHCFCTGKADVTIL